MRSRSSPPIRMRGQDSKTTGAVISLLLPGKAPTVHNSRLQDRAAEAIRTANLPTRSRRNKATRIVQTNRGANAGN